jgi:molybdenum cofactor biosynthesis enzyme MoaA
MAQQFYGSSHCSSTDQFADSAGGDHTAGLVKRLCDMALDSTTSTEFLQKVDVSAPILSKMKIGTFDDTSSLKLPDHNVTEKLLRRHLQQTACDWQHNNFIRPGLAQQGFAIFNCGQNWRCEFRTQNCNRVRIKSNRDRRPCNFSSQRSQLLQHHRVAAMDSIKIADRNAAFACTSGDMKIKNGHGQRLFH